jgi:hypothetical protein
MESVRAQKDVANPTLRANLAAYYKEFTGEFPEAKLTTDLKTKVTKGTEILVHTLKSKYHSMEKNVDGYLITGQHVRDADHLVDMYTTDWDILMSRTYADLTPEQYEIMRDKKELVKADMRRNAKTTDVFLDSLGIPENDYDKCRDGNVLSKQSIQVLNHDCTFEREQCRKQKIRERTDPGLIQLAKDKKKAAKVLEDDRKKLARELASAAKKAATIEAHRLDKEHEKSLTKEQLQEHKNAKKVAIAHKREVTASLKAKKEKDHEDECARARDLIGGNVRENDHEQQDDDNDHEQQDEEDIE